MINTQGMTEDMAKAAIRANYKREFAAAITANEKEKIPFLARLIELQGGDGIPQQNPPANTPPVAETAEQELARLREENARLKQSKSAGGTVSLKVSEKGGLSVYGLSRFPVTLYREQWTKLLDRVDDIRQFMKDHDKELVWKADKKA